MTDSDVEFQTTHNFLEVFDDDELYGDPLMASPVNTSPSSPTTETIIPFPVSKRVRRVTPKEQIDRLQDEIRGLAAHLHAIEAVAVPPHPHSHSRRSELWRIMALRQLEQRRISESESRELREMVKHQIEEAKSLSRILRRRTRIQRLREMLEDNHRNRPNETIPFAVAVQEGEQVFEEMLRDVNDIYQNMDALFTEKGMHSMSCPGRKRQSDNTVLNGVCFELMQREIVPFGVEKVKDAIWSSLGQLELEGLRSVRGFKTNVQFRKHDSSRDTTTAMVSFFADLSSGRSTSVKIRKVVRRYDEEHRTIFIYRTFMEPNPCNFRKPVGVHAISTLVIEIRYDDPDDDSTLIQSHFTVTRYDEELAAGHRLRLGVNLNISIAVWDEMISRIHDQVESYLVSRASCNPYKMIYARSPIV
ncbi:hypothetical protein PPTG_08998 [Phytophthora nicotianae INRA-310]|uniref:M96 mating-specific protein family n=1 Tax=Phytophthora nicotianae (strain INRA-310) TaxID=761204 RepID=W2QIM0_PHYN3|nr:hypothetical protein PPTG_08998 [Phytophthora nicotianae INRA-310]ETN13013.1 hypothetical protein PPTG_08998 [Phytophthora nicotianae INRA-310]